MLTGLPLRYFSTTEKASGLKSSLLDALGFFTRLNLFLA
jgi:hypothetical protein